MSCHLQKNMANNLNNIKMENKEKKQRKKNLSVQEYINALEEVKHQINLNPKVKTSRFASEFGFSKTAISDLKKLGVIFEVKHKGVFWVSNKEINEEFVIRLKKFMNINNKISTGGKKITGSIRGKKEPSKIARQQKFQFKSDVSTQPVISTGVINSDEVKEELKNIFNEKKPVVVTGFSKGMKENVVFSEGKKESVQEWENRIKEQKPDLTAIPISTEMNASEKEVKVVEVKDSSLVSEFINHHENDNVQIEENQSKEEIIEFRILGFTLFKYKKSRK